MGLSFFIQCACLVSFLVSLTLVHAQRRVFDVTNYGARGDGRTDNSKAFINAWNGACQNIGGGMVLFPKGTFVVAPVVLPGRCKGPMELEIQGTLQASKEVKDFINIDHWITIQYVDRLNISGGGTLDGLGADGWGYNDCLKNPGRCKQLPATLRLDFVTKGYINDITSINSKNTHINLFACKDVLIRNIKLSAPEDSPNTDGIHIGNSQNIYIVDSQLSTGDDCVSVLPGSQYINITGVQCGPGHGISIGSLGKGAGETVNDMYVTQCRFVGTQNGVRIKTWAVDSKPGTVSRVAFENLEMVNVDNPIIIDQEYCPGGGCNTQASSQVQISDVKFNDIRGTSATKEAVTLKCSRSKPCQNIELKDIDLTFRGPGGPAVSLCSNVEGRVAGLQKPISNLNTPRAAAYNEMEYDDLEGRVSGLQKPISNLNTPRAAAYNEIEYDDLEGRASGLQKPISNLNTPRAAAYNEEYDDLEGRAYGLQNPSWNLNTVQVSPRGEIEDPI